MASKNKKDHKFTVEQDNFLREKIISYTYSQLADAFNEEFGTKLSHQNVSDRCLRRLKIKRDRWHSFPHGKKDFNAYKIGTEIDDGHSIWVKTDDILVDGRTKTSKQQNPNWEKKNSVIYKKYHGKIPKNHLIIFLDKNYKNCDIENLYCTTRKVNFMMAKNKWYSIDPSITLAAIKWCELFYAIKDKELIH